MSMSQVYRLDRCQLLYSTRGLCREEPRGPSCRFRRVCRTRRRRGAVPGGIRSAPAASASPIPYIGGTHASRLCAVVRDSVAPAVVGLMNADQLIVQSQDTYAAMAGTPGDNERQTLRRIALGKTVTGLAHDLQVVQGVLMDDKRFPDPPKTDEDRLALKLRDHLARDGAAAERHVGHRQRRAGNRPHAQDDGHVSAHAAHADHAPVLR